MKWFLIFTWVQSLNCAPGTEAYWTTCTTGGRGLQLEMPSKEICEQIRLLNKQGECWAKTLEPSP